MGCENKPKYTCGDKKSNARCVFYDLDTIPSYSKLKEEECITLEETTEDLYKLVSWIRESIDTDNLNVDCLDVEKVNDTYKSNSTRYLLIDVIKALVDKSCSEVGANNETIGSIMANLDYKCLVDPCGVKPGTLQQLLQLMIDKLCPDYINLNS